MEESELLNSICKLEKDYNLNNEVILGIPIWRIVRYISRLYYINSKTGYVAPVPTEKSVGRARLKFFSEFIQNTKKRNLSIFFPFNRLVYIGGQYLDKFIDPVISESALDPKTVLIIDPPSYTGEYKRVQKNITINNESRTVHQQILIYFYFSAIRFLYGRKIKRLFKQAQNAFNLPDAFISRFYHQTALFLARYHYYLFWFKKLKPRRVFVVFREGYFPQIAVCKKLGIPVAEFQHGITIDNTVSFAGEYDSRIDPDYFLVFGEYWKGPQFGMPLDRIINIGWAYGKYLKKTEANNMEKHENEVLVISSPEISDAILDALKELSKAVGEYSFDIRLHPCESYNEAQKRKLQSIPKAKIVDNKTDSALILPTYTFVLGENSSVIYEALSVGCNVGMLNLCGLRPAIDIPGIKENFFVVNSAADFERFMVEGPKHSAAKAEFYSDFDSQAFINFINQNM